MSLIYPDTSTPVGYKSYTIVKFSQFAEIEKNQSNILDSYINHGISDDEAIRRLSDDKPGLDNIINDLEVIKVPAKYKNFHNTLIASFKDFSGAIGKEITAIQNHDINSLNDAISMTNSASSKLKQADDELKLIK